MCKMIFVLWLVFGATSVLADNMDKGKQAIMDLFPEVSSEQMTKSSKGPEYRFDIALSYKKVIRRVRRVYSTRQQFSAGMLITGFSRLGNGDVTFRLDDRGGNRIGSCRISRHGRTTGLLLSPVTGTTKALHYRVFKVRPRLNLFPLRH